MTPKEKAKEILKTFDNIPRYAKKAVDEMISEYQSMSDLKSKIVINDEVRFIVHQLEYWMLVKQEIEKL